MNIEFKLHVINENKDSTINLVKVTVKFDLFSFSFSQQITPTQYMQNCIWMDQIVETP